MDRATQQQVPVISGNWYKISIATDCIIYKLLIHFPLTELFFTLVNDHCVKLDFTFVFLCPEFKRLAA